MKLIKKQNIIIVPYPAQGHVSPMLNLAAFLAHEFQPIIVTPEFIHHSIKHKVIESQGEISFMSIPDGFNKDAPRDFFAIEGAMEKIMPVHMEKLINRLKEESGVACMVVDLLASWAIQVSNRCEVPVAGFWAAMLSTYQLISAIPHMIHKGFISADTGLPKNAGSICLVPNQPMVSSEDLPWLIGNLAARKGRFKFWCRVIERSSTLKWLFVNSFTDEHYNDDDDDDKLPNQLINEGSKDHPLVIPIIPLRKHDNKNPSFWDEDMSCIEWLDKHKPGTVVYISFGSWVCPIGESKVKNLALAIEASGRPFIWVLKNDWREGLPNGYLERVSKQGKIVSWAPQLDVLQHKAVGCYLTHCGWNSIVEAIQYQKPLLCYPVAGDQFMNCNYIVKVWKIGIRIYGFGLKEVEDGLTKVMMEDRGMDNRLKNLHERTMGEQAGFRVMTNLSSFASHLKIESPIQVVGNVNF